MGLAGAGGRWDALRAFPFRREGKQNLRAWTGR